MKKHHLLVTSDNVNLRLDLFLSLKLQKTRSSIIKLIKQKKVKVNGEVKKAGYIIKEGDQIQIQLPEVSEERLIPEPIPLKIVYKDDYLVVVDKPAGLVMYPAAGHYSGTLMNGLLYEVGRLATVGGPLRPGVVHRLDKDTSGLVVVALKDEAYYHLVEQFKQRTIERSYLAIVFGRLKEESGVIELPIGRSETHRKKMSTRTKRGKYAKTSWRVVQELRGATLIEARLSTGRTHQIRVHFASIGHPVIGDQVYGRKQQIQVDNKRLKIQRQMLHAKTLGFRHPYSEEWMRFDSPLPDDMAGILKLLS
ncbi:MAG: RluA family pseudouridine synthase [Nitrospirae bacterium]|nr:RluA family pseudouridine synthase [Nitrospirota bacterium]